MAPPHTNLLYAMEPTKSKFDAQIVSFEICEPTKKDPRRLYLIELTKTYFFISGGGQPGDNGIINLRDEEKNQNIIFKVNNVEERKDKIIHICTYDNQYDLPKAIIGKTIFAEVDMKKRKRRSQQHTGQHIISRVAEILYNNAVTSSFTITDDMCTIELSKEFTQDEIDHLESETNKIIENMYSISTFIIEEQNCNNDENVKLLAALKNQIAETSEINVAEVKLPKYPIRIVAIRNDENENDSEKWWDIGLCCGTHVNKTNEVCCLHIFSFNAVARKGEDKTQKNTRINFSCGYQCMEVLRKNSNILKQSSLLLSCGEPMVYTCIEKLQTDMKNIKKREKEFSNIAFSTIAKTITTHLVVKDDLKIDLVDTVNCELFDAIPFTLPDITAIAYETEISKKISALPGKGSKKSKDAITENKNVENIANIICGVIGKFNQNNSKFICQIHATKKDIAESIAKNITNKIPAKIAGNGEKLNIFLSEEENIKVCKKKETYDDYIQQIKNIYQNEQN